MANEVSHYNFLQTGAPTLAGVAGNLIAVLDAVLVNGWGSQTATSLTVAAGVATLTLPTTPAMVVHGLVEIAAVTGGPTGFALLNGKKKVLSIVGNVLTFDATGVSNGTATGTITAKVAAAGWTKAFTGTNKAAYKSGNVAASQCLLRVDDSATQVARVVGYETMSDVDTGVGAFPTASQFSGGLYWGKSLAASAVTRQWHIVADDRTFYIAIGSTNTADQVTNTNGASSWGFGDHVPVNSTDGFPAFICGSEGVTPYTDTSVNTGSLASLALLISSIATGLGKYLPRAYGQFGTAVKFNSFTKGLGLGNASGANNAGWPFPNPANNGLIVSKIALSEVTSIRGDLPGCYSCPQNLTTNSPVGNRDLFTGTGSIAGRKLMALRSDGPNVTTVVGINFFDITGPWR